MEVDSVFSHSRAAVFCTHHRTNCRKLMLQIHTDDNRPSIRRKVSSQLLSRHAMQQVGIMKRIETALPLNRQSLLFPLFLLPSKQSIAACTARSLRAIASSADTISSQHGRHDSMVPSTMTRLAILPDSTNIGQRKGHGCDAAVWCRLPLNK